MNFRAIAFLDTSLLTANLLLRHKQHFQDDKRRQEAQGSAHHDTETILLRGPQNASEGNWFDDVPHQDAALLKEFKSAKAMLTRIRNLLHDEGKPATLGKAMIVSLKPGGHVDWHVDEGSYAEAHNRFHICLVPSPGAMLYSGGEQMCPPVGQLVFFNNRVLHSAINLGPVARIHLIVDIRRPDVE